MSEAIAMRMRTVFSVRRTLGLPVALVAAVVVAEGAVLLLRPRDLGPQPLPVDARAYFSPAQLEKAETFRTGQLALYGGQLAIELGVLVVVARRGAGGGGGGGGGGAGGGAPWRPGRRRRPGCRSRSGSRRCRSRSP